MGAQLSRRFLPCILVSAYACIFLYNSLLVSTTIDIPSAAITDGYLGELSAFSMRRENVRRKESSRCAINLYGLPRSFQELVLPSLIKNVIQPNAPYNCDYFLHYFNVTIEEAGRSGKVGKIRPSQVYEIREPIVQASTTDDSRRSPVIAFASHTNDEFWMERNGTVQKIRHTRDVNGNYYYFPWKEKNYVYPQTTDNIIKMWHSIEAVWKLMEENEFANDIRYDRVAMLRSDLMYITPIDIYSRANGERDTQNKVTVIPNFAKYPVNDRLIYGPAEAVKIWAMERFPRMEDHVNRTFYEDEGYGLHSERFVARALLPVVQERGFEVEEHQTMCMLRARTNRIVWYRDCRSIESTLEGEVRDVVESVLGRKCLRSTRTFMRC